MSMNVIGYPVSLGNLKEVVKIATDFGIQDYNLRERSQTLEEAAQIEPHWTHVIVDTDGDVLLGRGAVVEADSLEEWKALVLKLVK